MKEKRGKGNQGFSLVELLVVLAIMAVLATAAVTGIGMLSGARMSQCVKKLDSALSEARVATMSKGSGSFLLFRDEKGNYYVQIGTGEMQKVAEDTVAISYVDSGSALEHPITKDGPLEIRYAAGSGAFLPLSNGTSPFPEEEESAPGEEERMSGGNEIYCEQIIVKTGERHRAAIRLVRDTGRHYVE